MPWVTVGIITEISISLLTHGAAEALVVVGAEEGQRAEGLCHVAAARSRPLIDAQMIVGVGLVGGVDEARFALLRGHDRISRSLGIAQ